MNLLLTTIPVAASLMLVSVPATGQSIFNEPLPVSWTQISSAAQWGACELYLSERSVDIIVAYTSKRQDPKFRLQLRELSSWIGAGIRLHISKAQGFRQLSPVDQQAARKAYDDVANKNSPQYAFAPTVWEGCQKVSLSRLDALDAPTKARFFSEAQEAFDQRAAKLSSAGAR